MPHRTGIRKESYAVAGGAKIPLNASAFEPGRGISIDSERIAALVAATGSASVILGTFCPTRLC